MKGREKRAPSRRFLAQVSPPGAAGLGAHIWVVCALVCVVGQAGLHLVLPVSHDRPGSAAPGAGVGGFTGSRRHPPGPSPSSYSCCRCVALVLLTARIWREAVPPAKHARCQGTRALRTKARAWPTRQPHSGRVKLGQNFQKSIPSF